MSRHFVLEVVKCLNEMVNVGLALRVHIATVCIACRCTNFVITSATSMHGLFEKSELMYFSVGWGARREGVHAAFDAPRCTMHPGPRGVALRPRWPLPPISPALTKSLRYVNKWTCEEKSLNDKHFNVCIASQCIRKRLFDVSSVSTVVMTLR